VFAEAAPGQQVRHNLRDVDFRRGNTGEARVVVDLSSPNIGIDIRQQGRQLVVDFLNTNLPRNLVRRLDVGDFGTPVRFVDTFDQGGNARMVLEPRGVWEYSAYQTDTQFIVEVKPVKEDPNKLVQSASPGYAGEKLSLNFQNVEVRAGAAGDRRLHGPQHHHQRHRRREPDAAPEGRALGPGARHHPAGQGAVEAQERQRGADRADRRAGREGKARARGDLGDLRPGAGAHRVVRALLRQGRGPEEAPLRQGPAHPLQARRGSIDERTNTLFIQDTGGRLDEARRLIQQLDVPVRQVLIEARIVIADDKWGRSLGARFGTQSAFNSRNYNFGVSGTGDRYREPARQQPAVARLVLAHLQPGRSRPVFTAFLGSRHDPRSARSPSSST
jgi:type IV pilus assembly protein PilQ